MIENIGDIIAAEPIARYAAQRDGAPVTWICRKPYAELVQSFPAVDRIVTVRCMTEWLLLWATERADRSPDMTSGRIWDLHISARPCPVCGISFRKSGAAGQITYDTYLNRGNLLKVNCLVAGIPVLDEAPMISPAQQQRGGGPPGACRSNLS